MSTWAPGGGTATFLPLRSAIVATSPFLPMSPMPWRAIIPTILDVSLPSLEAITVV